MWQSSIGRCVRPEAAEAVRRKVQLRPFRRIRIGQWSDRQKRGFRSAGGVGTLSAMIRLRCPAIRYLLLVAATLFVANTLGANLPAVTDALGNRTAYSYDGGNAGSHCFESSKFEPTQVRGKGSARVRGKG